MSEPITWAAVGMAAVSNMAVWLKIIHDKKNNSKNANPKMCIDHEKRITKTEAEMKGLTDNLALIRSENREDHQKIFNKLEELG
jgi:hypothetical protein